MGLAVLKVAFYIRQQPYCPKCTFHERSNEHIETFSFKLTRTTNTSTESSNRVMSFFY